MNSTTHCPYRQSTLLQQALAPDKMRIAFLLGAGCPVSIRVEDEGGSKPLIPDIRGLTSFVDTELKKSDVHKDSYAKLLSRLPSTSTIEDILTHLRSLLEVVRDGNIITAQGPAISPIIAYEIIEYLFDITKRKEIEEDTLFDRLPLN